MKSSTLLILGIGGVLVYLAWRTRAAINLNWTLQNVTPDLSGLATILNVSLLVSNTSTATVSLSNVNATLYYQGSPIASGGASATLNPGTNTVTIPFAVSDLTIVSDIIATVENDPASYNFQIKGTALVNGIPISFSTVYNIPSPAAISGARHQHLLSVAG